MTKTVKKVVIHPNVDLEEAMRCVVLYIEGGNAEGDDDNWMMYEYRHRDTGEPMGTICQIYTTKTQITVRRA